jgi:hypothetical protein
VIHLQRAPENARVGAELPTPEAVAHDHDLLAAREILGRLERAAARGSDAERGEHAGAQIRHARLPGSGGRGDGGAVGIERSDGLYRGRLLLELEEFDGAHRHALPCTLDRDDLDQPLRRRVRQRPQQRRVDHAEHRRAAAHPHRQRQDRQRGEPWLARESADALPEVEDEALHGSALPLTSSRPASLAPDSLPW